MAERKSSKLRDSSLFYNPKMLIRGSTSVVEMYTYMHVPDVSWTVNYACVNAGVTYYKSLHAASQSTKWDNLKEEELKQFPTHLIIASRATHDSRLNIQNTLDRLFRLADQLLCNWVRRISNPNRLGWIELSILGPQVSEKRLRTRPKKSKKPNLLKVLSNLFSNCTQDGMNLNPRLLKCFSRNEATVKFEYRTSWNGVGICSRLKHLESMS